MNDSNRHETIIVSAAKLMSLVGRLFTGDIVNSEPLANTYLNVAKTILAKTKYNEVRIELLHFFQSILRNIKMKINFEELANLFIKFTSNNIYKVSSSAFKAIHALLSTEQMVWSNSLGSAILERLKEIDIDHEIKNSIIGCASEILQKYPK